MAAQGPGLGETGQDADRAAATAVQQHQRLCAAFDALHPLDTAGRAAALDALRASDPDIVEDLQAMLWASSGLGLQLDQHGHAELPSDLGGERGYRVLREIGRGGMGRVLLGERADGRFDRLVAIKVLDRSPEDAEWRRRFHAERSLLARLQHPHIARLLDAGESPSGVPYLVMEFIDGLTLDQYLRTHDISVEHRVQLFEQIAAAVGYAHRMLVAHRDLKPGNILVSAEGTPHLLDFGIARLLDEGEATLTGQRALTPRYAAPEQVTGLPSSAALDIYQLGLLLYAMLCGEPPFASLDGAALLRAIVEQDPPPPSQRARQLGTGGPAKPGAIDADLDAICMRALRKSPEQRYPSVEAMLDDLARWRRGEAVLARRGGQLYRARKFVRRHWRALAVVALMLGSTAVFVWRLQEALARSERERAVAMQATELIVDVFGRADPSQAQGEELTLGEALDQSVARLQQTSELPDSVRARVLEAVGSTYIELSRAEQAIALLGDAAAAFERADDFDGAQRARHAQAIAIQDRGEYAQAQAALERIVEARTQHGSPADAFAAELHSSLAILHQYQRRPQQALAEFDRALAILRAMPEPDRAQLAHTLRNLGDIRTAQGDVEGGLAALQEAQVLTDALYGPDHPDSIRLQRMLGRNALRRDRFDEAVAHFELGWARAQKVFTPPHAVRTLLAHPLALAYLHRGDLVQAAEVMAQASQEVDALYPEGHPTRATVDADLALILLAGGDRAGARRHAAQALAARQALETPAPALAQPGLIMAVLDCLDRDSPEARAAVASQWQALIADTGLAPTLREDFRRAAQQCGGVPLDAQ